MNKKLNKLKEEIKNKFGKCKYWLFWDKSTWKDEEIKKFDEKGIRPFEWDDRTRIVFVAENPSEGTLPGNLVIFKKYLDDNELSGAFITDLIKEKSLDKNQVKKIEKDFWEKCDNHRKFFFKEIKIVEPCLIVAIGNKVERVLRDSRFDRKIPVEKIRHYSRTNHTELKKEIKRIANIYYNSQNSKGRKNSGPRNCNTPAGPKKPFHSQGRDAC